MADLLDLTFDEIMAPPDLPARVEQDVYTSARGAKKKDLKVRELYALTQEDLDQLDQGLGVTPTSVKKIRDSHHRLAMMLAQGVPPMECSTRTGYSPSRISVLQRDPAFMEILAFYQDTRKEIFVDVIERFKDIALDASGEVADRLSDQPDSFTNGQLLEVIKTLGDRAGYAPVQKVQAQHIVGVFSADRMNQIKEQVDAASRGRVIRTDQQGADATSIPRNLPTSDRTAVGKGTFIPSVIRQNLEIARLESSGAEV